jgi:hypothetical protein
MRDQNAAPAGQLSTQGFVGGNTALSSAVSRDESQVC